MCRHYREKLLLVTREVDALRRDQARDDASMTIERSVERCVGAGPGFLEKRRDKVRTGGTVFFLLFSVGLLKGGFLKSLINR